jgi:hypothetical protein
MEINHNKSFVGAVNGLRKQKGWFFSAPVGEPLAQLEQR